MGLALAVSTKSVDEKAMASGYVAWLDLSDPLSAGYFDAYPKGSPSRFGLLAR